MVTKGRRRKVTNVQISPLSSFVPAPRQPPYTHSTSLEPGNRKSVRLLHCSWRHCFDQRCTSKHEMSEQARSKVPLIKDHSRFMILSDGLTDHGHESMSRLSLCHFKKNLKGFSFALSESCCDPARSPTGGQCLLNCCNYKTRDITETIALSPKKRVENGKIGVGR